MASLIQSGDGIDKMPPAQSSPSRSGPNIKTFVVEHLEKESSNFDLKLSQVDRFIEAISLNPPSPCRHILLVYEEIESARNVEMRYLKSRLQKGESCVCLAHNHDIIRSPASESDLLRTEMIDSGIDVDQLERAGQLEIFGVPNSELGQVPISNEKKEESINSFYIKLVTRLFTNKRPPFAGFGIIASESDLNKAEYLSIQLELEQIAKERSASFKGSWICPYKVDNILESLEEGWMARLLLSHDAVIYLPKFSSGVALLLTQE